MPAIVTVPNFAGCNAHSASNSGASTRRSGGRRGDTRSQHEPVGPRSSATHESFPDAPPHDNVTIDDDNDGDADNADGDGDGDGDGRAEAKEDENKEENGRAD